MSHPVLRFSALSTKRARLFIALALCTALVGCSGGARSSLPSTGSAESLPARKAHATFRIDVPKQAATATLRSPRYVSPATTQLAIDIEQGGVPIAGYPVTVGLTPTSNGCTSTLASTNCQLTVALGPGSYTATLTTEDASSTPLSSAQSIAFTITAGTNNVISIVLSGIPHAFQIASAAQAVVGSGSSGLTLYGSAAQPLTVVALDADGNLIVGSGSPTYRASLESGSGWSASTPSTTAPNTIAITPPGTNGSVATFSVTASYSDATCSQSGAVCTATFTIKDDLQMLFVAQNVGNTVTEYAPPYTGTPTTISNGVSTPQGMALDAADDLFVADLGSTTDWVTEYASPYTGSPTTITNGVNGPERLEFDAAGNLFVPNSSGNTITEYVPPFTGTPTTISNGINMPNAVVFDSSGDLFAANCGSNCGVSGGTVTEYAPPYTGTPTTTISSGVNGPFALVLDSAGNLFVANATGNTITEYAPPYTGTPTTISSGVNNPWALVFDGSGNLFVANCGAGCLGNGTGNGSVTEYAPPYTGTPTTITSGVSLPDALVLDHAGNLFVSNLFAGTSGTVTEYAPPYTGTPTTITNGMNRPDALLITP
jgi:sugar lactone lactonase YvrE